MNFTISSHRLASLLGSLLCFCLHGQIFVNLDFESATIAPLPPGQFNSVPVAYALPGWQVFYGTDTTPVTTVLHNNNSIGTRNLSIFGPQYNGAYSIIEGQFMPFLQAGFPGVAGFPERTVTIEQSGLVPAFAQSLQFKVGILDANFSISLNGQTLSLVPLDATPAYAKYGVDVTSFAGQVADLRFTSFSTPVRADNWVAVDSFQFLSTAVPEPSTWALLVLGSALFWCAARRRRK